MAKKAEKKIETASVPKVLKVGVAAGVPPEEKRTYTYDARSYRSDVLIPAYSFLRLLPSWRSLCAPIRCLTRLWPMRIRA